MGSYVVEIWAHGGDIASNRYVGPFRSEVRANIFAEDVRHAFAESLDSRVIELESPGDNLSWLRLRRWDDQLCGRSS